MFTPQPNHSQSEKMVENGSLLVGDILHVYKIKKGSILEAECVIRGGTRGNYRTNGEVNIINIIEASCTE